MVVPVFICSEPAYFHNRFGPVKRCTKPEEEPDNVEINNGARSSKPLPQNSLHQKLSCFLQDRSAGGLGHDPAVCADSVQRPAGESGDTCASSRDAAHAISAGCPSRPDDIQDRFGFCGCDSPNAGGAGSRRGYKRSVAAGRGKVGTAVGNSHSGERQTKTALLCLSFSKSLEAKKFRISFRVLTASPGWGSN
jgi:hypothetical protein